MLHQAASNVNMIVRKNSEMSNLWRAHKLDEAVPHVVLQPALQEVVQGPFVRRDGCLLLERFAAASTGTEAFRSKTEYEEFINHFHPDDYIDDFRRQAFGEVGAVRGDRPPDAGQLRVLLCQSVKASLLLAKRLDKETLMYRLVLSVDLAWPTARLGFSEVRADELPAFEADPEQLRREPILLIDAGGGART